MARPGRVKPSPPKPKAESPDDAVPWWQCDAPGPQQVDHLYGLQSCTAKSHKGPCPSAGCMKGLLPIVTAKAYLQATLGVDLREQRRQEGVEAGLRNLGNTCYLNSILQTWYHDPHFRQAVYTSSGNQPVTAELRRVFARMQLGLQRCVEPRALVAALEVDPAVQQDADEFWNAMVTSLEDMWSNHPTVAPFLGEHFRGHLMYETVCSRCRRSSWRAEAFYGLSVSIKGHTQLEDALRASWEMETLTGSNQYHCEQCGLQDAVRSVQVRKLPRVLVLKLLRFVYDPKKGVRQKVPHAVGYPSVLQLGPLGVSDPTQAQYELTGVVFHKGKTCYHGHYIAHFRDWRTGQWHQADDDTVEPLKDRARGKKGEEGRNTSGEVYMLMYTRQGTARPDTLDLPPELLTEVQEENSEYLKATTVYESQASVLEQRVVELEMALQPVLETEPPSDSSEPFFFVGTSWLQAVMKGRFLDPEVTRVEVEAVVAQPEPPADAVAGPEADGAGGSPMETDSPRRGADAAPLPIAEKEAEGDAPMLDDPLVISRSPDFSYLLCSHGKVRPSPATAYRVVTESVWAGLQRCFPGCSYGHEMVCLQCVQEELLVQRVKQDAVAAKEEALRLYRESESKLLEYGKTGMHIGLQWVRAWGKVKPTKADLETLQSSTPLSGVVCLHGGLSPYAASRRLIPDAAWAFIAAAYHVPQSFSVHVEDCAICRDDKVVQSAELVRTKNEKIAERKVLRALYDWKEDETAAYFRNNTKDFIQSQNKKLQSAYANKLAQWQAECKALRKKAAAPPPRTTRSASPTSPAAAAAAAAVTTTDSMEVDGAEETEAAAPSTPSTEPLSPVLETYQADRFLVPSEWVHRWRGWVDSVSDPNVPRPDDCRTEPLLCDSHAQFLYTTDEYRPTQGRQQRRKGPACPTRHSVFCLVDKAAWDYLVDTYSAGPAVKFTVQGEEVVVQPSPCPACAEARRQAEAEAIQHFVQREVAYEGTAPQGRRGAMKPFQGRVTCSHFDRVGDVRLKIYQIEQDRIIAPGQIFLSHDSHELTDEDAPLLQYSVVPDTVLKVTVLPLEDVTTVPSQQREGSEVGFARSALAGANLQRPGEAADTWACHMCTYENHQQLAACEICGTPHV